MEDKCGWVLSTTSTGENIALPLWLTAEEMKDLHAFRVCQAPEKQCVVCKEKREDLTCYIFGDDKATLCGMCVQDPSFKLKNILRATCVMCHSEIDNNVPEYVRSTNAGATFAISNPEIDNDIPECMRELTESRGNEVFVYCSPECGRQHKKKQKQMIKVMGSKTHAAINIKPINACENCQKASENMKKCSRCKIVYYCCKKCQATDWKKHKKTCERWSGQ